MILNKIKIENFKKVRNVELDLADINILVGGNGSGKSSMIQAIHLASSVMRQAGRVDSKTSTVDIDDLDYLPTNDYKLLGFNSTWGNKDGSPSSKITFSFLDPQQNVTNSAYCELRSARNAGISIKGHVPTSLTSFLRNKKHFFSAYIPGISGIPNKEEKKAKKVILKACSYGDSNVVLRNVLLLLKNENQVNISDIESWVREIMMSPISIDVAYNEDNDLSIKCKTTINGTDRPIELSGTGYLQLIQLFCYILLFKPAILLVDEPDIHLHPTAQSKLLKVLSRIASERKIRVILSTHSPFIVRDAPTNANVYWLENGQLNNVSRQSVELALGWGTFGKKVIIVTEDKKTIFLKHIISQWPQIDRLITILPGSGYQHLPNPEQANELCESLGGMYKVVIYRDRDSLTDSEVEKIKHNYSAKGANIIFSAESDLESYFCNSDFVGELCNKGKTFIDHKIDTILHTKATDIKNSFDSQRQAHNQELHKTGGSPTNEDVWDSFQTRPLKGAKGKFLFNQLKNALQSDNFDEVKVTTSNIAMPNTQHIYDELMSVINA